MPPSDDTDEETRQGRHGWPVSDGLDFVVVMGIAGTGKSAIAAGLADALGCAWIEADSLHSAESIERMRQGIGLTDKERLPWLGAVCDAALAQPERPVVIACSALRRLYRDLLRRRLGNVRFVFLDGPSDLIEARLGSRQGHFATTSLLKSQIATLEPPEPDEHPIRIAITLAPETIVAHAAEALRQK